MKLWEENYFENDDENFNQYLVEIEASTRAKRLHFLDVSTAWWFVCCKSKQERTRHINAEHKGLVDLAKAKEAMDKLHPGECHKFGKYAALKLSTNRRVLFWNKLDKSNSKQRVRLDT